LKNFRPDALTVLLLGLLVYFWFRPPAWVSDTERALPPLHFVLLDGRKISLAELRGKVVLVNFWATWCPYCRHEMPDMDEFYRDYRARGFEIVALSQDDDAETVRRFMLKEGYMPCAGEIVRLDCPQRAHCRVANCLCENDHTAQFAPCIASRWEQSNPDNFPRARHSFPVALADSSHAAAFGGVSRLPTSFLIDKQGRLRKKISGQVHYARLEELVGALLEKK